MFISYLLYIKIHYAAKQYLFHEIKNTAKCRCVNNILTETFNSISKFSAQKKQIFKGISHKADVGSYLKLQKSTMANTNGN